MSIREVTYYQAVCDWPGCEMTAQEHGEYTAWGDPDAAWDDVENADWHEGSKDGECYCDGHPTVWASDHEKGEPFPDPPYLLIHDGDTDNPDDDGKVSLIGGAT